MADGPTRPPDPVDDPATPHGDCPEPDRLADDTLGEIAGGMDNFIDPELVDDESN
jgi:hypothetical protein